MYYNYRQPQHNPYQLKGNGNETTLKDFQIIKKLGEGSFGVVFQVRRLVDNNIYGLKKVRLTNMPQKEKENALNEIRLLASIESDFIISYKEAFLDHDSSTLCLVLEFAESGDLLKELTEKQKRNQPYSEESLWKALTQLTLGLKALHSNKILHRDLKCANVFISKDGIYKLGDLNVSKVSAGLARTQTGTPYYASPEVWQDKPYGDKSDIWSLGCVIYEMATFKPPFRAQDMKGLYRRVIQGNYDPLPTRYSQAFKDIIAKLLVVDPSKRLNAEQILNDKIVTQFIDNNELYKDNKDTIKQDLLKTILVPRNLKGIQLPKSKYDDGKKKESNDEEVKRQRVMSADIRSKQQSSYESNQMKLVQYQNSKGKMNVKTNKDETQSKPTNQNESIANNYHSHQQSQNRPPIAKNQYHSNQYQSNQQPQRKPNLPMNPGNNVNVYNNDYNRIQQYVNRNNAQLNRPNSMRSIDKGRSGSVDRVRASNDYQYLLHSPRGSRQISNASYQRRNIQSPHSNQRLAAGQQIVRNQVSKPSWYG